MSVVHVVSAGEIGGAERMLVDLARDATRACSIALLTPNDALRRLFVDAGLPVDDRGPVREGPLPFLASSLGMGDVRWLDEVLARRRATIVHLHTFASQVLGTRAAARAGVRIVRTEHSTRAYEDPSCWPFARWSLPRADAVVFISEHVRRVACERSSYLRSTSRASVIPNGVDPEHFAPRPRTASGRVRFVALGRLDARKGLDLAIAAIACVDGTELEIVGEGDQRRALEAAVRAAGIGDRVRFAGYAGDVRDAIARSDAVLSSAREEGLGIALLEAMAMERPVVAVPVGGIPEIVRSGETGWLASDRSVSGLVQAIRGALDAGERARRGALARQRVLERFSLHAMRTGYEAVYASLTT